MTHLKYITVYVAKHTIYIEVHCCVNKYIHNVTTAIAAPQMVVKPILRSLRQPPIHSKLVYGLKRRHTQSCTWSSIELEPSG